MKTERVVYELARYEEVSRMATIRTWLQNKYRNKLDDSLKKGTIGDLKQSAMIFAPHQDDETLGCGGTIIRKRSLDVDVDVVFLTDGHTSHRHLMPPDVLSAVREEEATAACAKLGVPAERLTFLRYPDGYLKTVGDIAARLILDLLRERQPREIYIPYARDPQPDHAATNKIVRSVLKASGLNATVLEYPVWAWYQWPWVSMPSMTPGRTVRQVLANSAKLNFGMRLSRDMNYAIATNEVRQQKIEALNEHRTQMTRMNGNPDWATLHDVANGDWLDYFLQRDEIFCRYKL